MVICAGNIESFKFATPVGIGMIESAMNLTRLILFDKPEFLIFIGSAGSYGKYKTFDIIESSVASNIENSFWLDGSYTPIDNVIKAYHEDNVSRETINIVNSSNYITTDEKLSKYYTKQKIELENMEFFSVLRVAQEFKIPVHGILIVTNYCNKDAHKDFITNHQKAKYLLSEYMLKKYRELKT